MDLGNILLLSLICIDSEGSSILFALMIRQIPSLIAKKHAGIGSQFGAKVILTMSKKFLEVTSFEISTSLLLILFVDYPINCWKSMSFEQVNVGHGFQAPSCGINEVQDC